MTLASRMEADFKTSFNAGIFHFPGFYYVHFDPDLIQYFFKPGKNSDNPDTAGDGRGVGDDGVTAAGDIITAGSGYSHH